MKVPAPGSGVKQLKNFAAAVLGVIALIAAYSALAPDGPTPQQTAQEKAKKQTTAASLAETIAGPTPGKGKQALSAENLDPTLRLDLLRKLEATKYEGSNRNIFQFYTPPPPPPPPIDRSVEIARQNAQQNAPPPGPPPPPPIPLKFYGLASSPGVSPRKAFLQHDELIFIAMEGDIVEKRYKVVKINDNSIEMEDTQNKSKQKLPLQES